MSLQPTTTLPRQKFKKHSPGVYCYISDSDEEDTAISTTLEIPQDQTPSTVAPIEIQLKRSRRDKKEEPIENTPYLPSSLSDIIDIAGNFAYVKENKEYNALDYHIHDIR